MSHLLGETSMSTPASDAKVISGRATAATMLAIELPLAIGMPAVRVAAPSSRNRLSPACCRQRRWTVLPACFAAVRKYLKDLRCRALYGDSHWSRGRSHSRLNRALVLEPLDARLMLSATAAPQSSPPITTTVFNGFELYTSAAVELGGFSSGLAIDNGVVINAPLSISPFGATQPGSLPAQPAALLQLAGVPPVTTAAPDIGQRLPAGIVDLVLGFDAIAPQEVSDLELELGRDRGSSGGGGGYLGAADQETVQEVGNSETLDPEPVESSSRVALEGYFGDMLIHGDDFPSGG
jgi:hypothetical protein